jgi:hypothetical protein
VPSALRPPRAAGTVALHGRDVPLTARSSPARQRQPAPWVVRALHFGKSAPGTMTHPHPGKAGLSVVERALSRAPTSRRPALTYLGRWSLRWVGKRATDGVVCPATGRHVASESCAERSTDASGATRWEQSVVDLRIR